MKLTVFTKSEIAVMKVVIKQGNVVCLENINQLLDEVEQNIVTCRWRADQLFAEGRGK